MFKSIKKLTGECPVCEAKRELAYGTRVETLTVRGKKIHIDTNAYYCKEGGHYFYDPKDEEKKFQEAYSEYRKQEGLLQPEEIKEVREKYGLSQKAFARFLGWGEITVQRYESGALQDNAHNNLLLLIKEPGNFLKLFDARKPYLPQKDLVKISKKLEKAKQFDLASAFKRTHEKRRSKIIYTFFPKVQFTGEYKHYKPINSDKGELALAS